MTDKPLEIVINGNSKILDSGPGVTLAEALAASGYEENMDGLAVAVNDTVVPKHEWPEHKLDQGDRLEVIKAVQGG